MTTGVYNIADYGAVPGDPALAGANSDAIDAALADLVAAQPQRDPYGNPLASGGILYIPPGVFYVNRTIVLRRTTNIQGAGGAGFASASQLWFTTPVAGVHVLGTFDWPTQPDEAPNSVIRDVRIRAMDSSNPDAHGFLLETAVSLQNFGIWGFGGNGVHAVTGDVFPNCNCLHMHYGHIYYCKNGVYLKATNANAGTFIALNAAYNREYGIWDDSFLGNTHVGHHTASNVLGGYRCDGPASNSQFMGCYSEMDQPTSVFGQFVTVWGGDHGAGVQGGAWVGAGLVGSMGSGFHVRPSVVVRYPMGPRPFEVRLGAGLGNIPTALSFQADEESGAHDLAYNSAAGDYDGPGSGWWSLICNNTSEYLGLAIAGTKAKDWYGYPVGQLDATARCPAGSVMVPRLFFRQLDGQAMPKVTFAEAPPTNGMTGDVVFNAKPGDGRPAFWQCQEDGTWVAH